MSVVTWRWGGGTGGPGRRADPGAGRRRGSDRYVHYLNCRMASQAYTGAIYFKAVIPQLSCIKRT